MSFFLQRALFVLLLAGASLASAQQATEAQQADGVQEIYTFDNDTQRAVYKATLSELRCPKCQNQNIADSDAPIAKDIKRKVYQKIKAGEPREAIVDYLVERYGDFVRYRPRLTATTALLWFGPPLLVVLVLLALLLKARRQTKTPTTVTQENSQSVVVDKAVADLLDRFDIPGEKKS